MKYKTLECGCEVGEYQVFGELKQIHYKKCDFHYTQYVERLEWYIRNLRDETDEEKEGETTYKH